MISWLCDIRDWRRLSRALITSLSNPEDKWTSRLRDGERPPYVLNDFTFRSERTGVRIAVDSDGDVRINGEYLIPSLFAGNLRRCLQRVCGLTAPTMTREEFLIRMVHGGFPTRVRISVSPETIVGMWKWLRENCDAQSWWSERWDDVYFARDEDAVQFRMRFSEHCEKP